jgi:uncharacterized protein (TIGR01777 family)
MNVLITGATGLIGQELGKKLCAAGHKIFVVTRDPEQARLHLPYPCELIKADLLHQPLAFELKNERGDNLGPVEAVVHLAGENVGEGRWTAAKKKKILASREQLTQNLWQGLKHQQGLRVFVGVSAIGYYGDTGDQLVKEESPSGTDFLADVCRKWEAAISGGDCPRLVTLRLGVVLAPFGGAFLKMLRPFQFGLGAELGSGRQWMSWIHLQDVVGVMAEALTNEAMVGVYNAVAPEPVTNSDFSQMMVAELRTKSQPEKNRSRLMRVPAAVLRLGLGEQAQIVLASQKVSGEKIRAIAGHVFQFPQIAAALADCCSPYRDGQQVFYAEQFLPYDREEVFAFFTDAKNLERVTPVETEFKVVKMSTSHLEKGTVIDYNLKFMGKNLDWTYAIKEWNPPHQFSDIQIKGILHQWHHVHTFVPLAGGTLAIDRLSYQLPMGKVGELGGGWVMRAEMEKLFAYRQKILSNLFPISWPKTTGTR